MKCKNKKKQKYKNLPKCPKCKSDKVVKRGFRYTENRGKVQRFFCKKCSHRFIENNGFYRMRNHEKKITLCLDLYFRGMSLRKIQEHLQAFYPKNSSHMTILRWVRKYSLMIGKFTKRLKLNVGSEIEVDEMECKTKGKVNWLVNGIDTKTRFLIFSEYMKARTKDEIKKLLINTKERTEEKIRVVTTDGFLLYRNLVLKSFGYNNKERKYNVKHNIVNASQGEGFNYRIERLHSNIRERTKVCRGFGSLESARAILIGYSIFHNFVKRHQTINKRPYELAMPELKLGTNKWLDLIKLANTNNLK